MKRSKPTQQPQHPEAPDLDAIWESLEEIKRTLKRIEQALKR